MNLPLFPLDKAKTLPLLFFLFFFLVSGEEEEEEEDGVWRRRHSGMEERDGLDNLLVAAKGNCQICFLKMNIEGNSRK